MTNPSLGGVFLASVARCPDRHALEIGEEVYTYAELHERVRALSATLASNRAAEGPALTAVLGQRTTAGFVGILGALLSGNGYVPILPSFPVSRIAVMLRRSESRELVVDNEGMARLHELLEELGDEVPLTIVAPDQAFDPELLAGFPRHRFIGPEALEAPDRWSAPEVALTDIAYVLFTSGSTGQPKGVMVNHGNILRFLDVVEERYELTEEDRFSHMFDVTFDLSLFDMFAAWKVGGCLCCPTARHKLLPAGFVVESGITIWFSVPSTALLMKKTRTLTDGAFPALRISLFCGEALPVEIAKAWARAAPNSIVENIYGPTELTLACTAYRWEEGSEAVSVNEVVPIGDPFPGMRARVVTPDLHDVPAGQDGELIMTGPQLTPGYLNDPEKTAKAFVVPPGETETFYRTGDRVRQPAGAPMVFLGRVDNQTKIRGYRVELGEIEAVMRREAGVDAAIALGWPPTAGGADAVVGFIDDATVDVAQLRQRMAAHLPGYMVPREIRVVAEFPLNTNGKIDRKALRAMLQ